MWAPCLTYADGIFYLVYSNVRSFSTEWQDVSNYLVTSSHILGPWSDPVYLNSSGFDASLFHDDDGHCWLVNMVMDQRKQRLFGGIVLQEYDKREQQLSGRVFHIFQGTDLGCTEGPHLYKRNGYYYLLTAEGGTGYEHCMTVARSRSITGPYEVHPKNPLMTSRHTPEAYLQKTGHGALVQAGDGGWYTSFLTARPLTTRGRCITGRESGIESIEWRADGWPYLAGGGQVARQQVAAPKLQDHVTDLEPEHLDFDGPDINIHFQALRQPMTPDWVNQTERQGFMRIHGRESLSSCFDQSLVARRVQAHSTEASTSVQFQPKTFQQLAGLVCYYNSNHYHYLHIHGDDIGRGPQGEDLRKFINVMTRDAGRYQEGLVEPIDISGVDTVSMRVRFDGPALRFYFAIEDNQWLPIGPLLDGSILSDDYVAHSRMSGVQPAFTGAFIGLCCQDLSGMGAYADFTHFTYKEID
jgi:xylan 1,4-beta-xylosidase